MLILGLVGAVIGGYISLFWLGTDANDRKFRVSTVVMVIATLGMVLVAMSGASIPFIAVFGFLCIFAGIRLLVTPDISGTDVLGAIFFIPIGTGFTLGWLWNDAYAVHREFFVLTIIMFVSAGLRLRPRSTSSFSEKRNRAIKWLKEN